VEIRQVGHRVDAILETDQRDVIEETNAVLRTALHAEIGRRVVSVGEATEMNELGKALRDVRIRAWVRMSDSEPADDQGRKRKRKRKRKRSGTRPAPSTP
jgi:hypothetical protein